MLLLISLIASVIEIRDLVKEKRIGVLFFFIFLMAISIFLYLKREDVGSLTILFEKLKEVLNGKD